MNLRAERQQRVQETVASIMALFQGQEPNRELLKLASQQMQRLAQASDLFPLSDFPPPSPASGTTSSRYLLSEQPDRQFALYLNTIIPGKSTQPHNHGTWAVIVALSGQELNRLYRRTDDGSVEGRGTLELERELIVQPGQPIEFMPQDIHSIHVDGKETVRHLHFYGRALDTLTDRIGFDLEKGTVHNYNRNFMRPTVGSDM
ncbi:cysteine dioxygenase family protein [Hydrogenophaga sp. BPS33]|uniref:cysteine dioxygenase family protein n=1 Tax=Hydrogenophaga sp. BPS33 TaxID=2651974 RepID=UPI00131F6594|nr:cysteine dioxygenase family protein [Hydrogenophaga sp. BPS33]QHE84198.1 cysteine dioxygenase [Hydrogenophaga sp. BPS33]